MKIPNKQSMRVILEDGSTQDVCCGPKCLSLGPTVRAYQTIDDKIQCQNRGDIDRCPVRRQRAEAKKKVEKRIEALRAKAAILRDEANELERRIK